MRVVVVSSLFPCVTRNLGLSTDPIESALKHFHKRVFVPRVIRIFSWRNSGVWRSILLGLKRSNAIWKADNKIYLLTISDLGFTIEFWLFGEIFPNRHFSTPDFKSVCGYILGTTFSNSEAASSPQIPHPIQTVLRERRPVGEEDASRLRVIRI